MAWMEGSDYQLEFCNDDPHPGVISQLSAIQQLALAPSRNGLLREPDR